ncbi:DUF1254 domain-containing protein [Nocardia brevicatena]|uniref:DUF1254 domain-containing protein n=1 Tax=Nocardia brevicatena TaxID=37327 RepID=UPI0003142282|nr:DUF1254 domain-containing protein [Nocardia brevicatena]
MGDNGRGPADISPPRGSAFARHPITRRTTLGVLAAGAGLVACGHGGEGETTPSGTPADRQRVATDAYVFGYPLVLLDVLRSSNIGAAPVNRLRHADAPPTPELRGVIHVDVDTLYSAAWLDLRREPVLYRMPPVESGRYWMTQLVDAWANTAHSPTSVRPRVPPGSPPPYTYAAIGPGWSGTLPEGVTPLPVGTPDAWFIGRIEVHGEEDIPAVRAVQDGMRLAPLSEWESAGDTGFDVPPPQVLAQAPTAQLERMYARDFFERMCALMEKNPPTVADEPALQQFATIGIRPGGGPRGISDDELQAGAAAGIRRIAAYVDPGTQQRSGWVINTQIGNYGTNYLLRATTAWHALGVNVSEEVLYMALFHNADERGEAIPFRLRFVPGQAPPVDAFWSMTAYDGDGFLIANAAEIYSVGHPRPVQFASDGSVELAIQYADPGSSVPSGNWLPIPEAGPFSLLLRMYAPKREALEGLWSPLPLTQ